MTTTSHTRTALITGASEGIGRALAVVMANDGWNLVVVARRESLLDDLAAEIKSRALARAPSTTPRVVVIAVDLTSERERQRLIEQLRTEDIQIDALVNNAGFGLYGLFHTQDSSLHRAMIDLNLTALVDLTRQLLPEMIARGRGMVMNIASTASFQAVPTNALYAATKAMVLSFSEAIAEELSGTGVTVTCLCPGVTRTGFARVAGADHLDVDFRGALTAEEVARIGYRAMLKGKRIKITGRMNTLLAFGTRFVSRHFATSLAMKVMRKRRT